MKRLLALVCALVGAVLLASPALASAPDLSATPTVASVATALRTNPVYVDPATQTGSSLRVDSTRLTAVVPAGVHLAVLQSSVLPAGTDPTELPALISSRLDQGGTFIVLIDRHFYGASTTNPGQLADELAAAQAALPQSGDATPALIALSRSLNGAGDIQDSVSPSRAGGPIGAGLLLVIAGVLVVGGLGLWWWLKRKPRTPRRLQEPQRDLVEIDYEGNVVNRTPAAERRQ